MLACIRVCIELFRCRSVRQTICGDERSRAGSADVVRKVGTTSRRQQRHVRYYGYLSDVRAFSRTLESAAAGEMLVSWPHHQETCAGSDQGVFHRHDHGSPPRLLHVPRRSGAWNNQIVGMRTFWNLPTVHTERTHNDRKGGSDHVFCQV